MFKTIERLFTVFLIISLLSLGQLAAMPASGSGSDAFSRGPAADEDQGLVEIEDDYAPSRHRKSSAAPIIIGLLAAGAVAAVLFLVVLKTKYNIVGTWNMVVKAPGYLDWTTTITFSGDKKSGSFRDGEGDTGTYTVDGENVVFSYSAFDWNFTGRFMDKNSMSGNHDFAGGTWSATKSGASISGDQAKPLSSSNNPFKKRIRQK